MCTVTLSVSNLFTYFYADDTRVVLWEFFLPMPPTVYITYEAECLLESSSLIGKVLINQLQVLV